MAAIIQPIGAVNMLGLYSFPMPPFFLEGASQSFIVGSPLILASGLITVAGTSPIANLVGISVYKASGVTNNQVWVVPFLSNLIFEISVDAAASGGNAPGTGSLAQSNVGTVYGITKDGTSGNWYLDTSKSTVGTNACAELLGFQTQPTTTTSYAGVVNGRALVRFPGILVASTTPYQNTIWS